jgi:SAM-dependent methyltransferase
MRGDAAVDVAALNAAVARDGWARAYDSACKAAIAAGAFVEDDRIADWQYLLPLQGSADAMVIGAGLGTMPTVLARSMKNVTVVETNEERRQLVDARVRFLGQANVQPRPDASDGALNGRFDLVASRACDWSGPSTDPAAVIALSARVLKPNGWCCLTLFNRWSATSILRGGETRHDAWSKTRYEAALAAAGFTDIVFYAVIPSVEAPPLFWVPLTGRGAFRYFLRDLLGLLDLASPEARSRFQWLLRVSRIGVSAALALRLTSVAAHFAPAFGVTARRCAS